MLTHTPRSNEKFRLYNLSLGLYLAVRDASANAAYLSSDVNSPDTLFYIVPLRTEERILFQNGNSFGLLTCNAGVHIHVSNETLVRLMYLYLCVCAVRMKTNVRTDR